MHRWSQNAGIVTRLVGLIDPISGLGLNFESLLKVYELQGEESLASDLRAAGIGLLFSAVEYYILLLLLSLFHSFVFLTAFPSTARFFYHGV